MSLPGLSIDAITHVLEYLDGIAVSRLASIGNSLLTAKIGQSAKNISFKTWPCMKLPLSLFRLPHLESLDLEQNEHCYSYPWRLNRSLPLPPMPMKSLTKLAMRCAQSFSVLVKADGLPVLETCFPHLKSLNLRLSTVPLSVWHLEAVPPGLTELRLHASRTPDWVPPIPCSALNNLPKQLEVLSLSTPAILVDPSSKDYSTVVWPAALRHLSIYNMDPSIVYQLPEKLEKLTLSLTPNADGTVKLPIPTSVLPKSLISVCIDNTRVLRRPEATWFHPTTFPPNLTHCELLFHFEQTVASDWDFLPKSITKMPLSRKFAHMCPIHLYLPNLEVITGLHGMGAFPESLLQNLPQKLLQLYAMYVGLEEITQIPPALEYLDVRIRPVSLSHPDVTIWSSIPPACDMSRLPSTLQSLELRVAPGGHRFSKVDLGHLPRNLRYLYISLDDVEDAEALWALPRDLDTLMTDIDSENDLRLDSGLLDGFPVNLDVFTLNLNALDAVWQDWMNTISQWTRLDTLQITLNIIPEAMRAIDMDVLLKLPKSLTYLDLPIHHSELEPQHFANLPGGLVSLILQVEYMDGSTCSASDECFANLPRSLTQLELPRKLVGLSPDIFNLLSSNILILSGPRELEELRDEFLERNWEGYMPQQNHRYR